MDFFWAYVWPLIIIVAQSVMLLVILLVAIAYVLLADRKIWAAVQIRRGPNVVGPWGLFQSFADLLKFVVKEPVIPAGANKGVFLLAPLVTCVLALAAWAVIPVNPNWVIANINVGVLYIFAISSLMIAFLALETLMVGTFSALDLVLFYLFFEGGLIPMFLIIGIWGGARRVYASFKFFLYTLLGSVLMLLAIMRTKTISVH